MPKSPSEYIENGTPRRTVIAGALTSMASAATAAVPHSASASQDAALLAACARFDRLAEARWRADQGEYTDDEVTTLMQQYHAAVNTIARTPAHTPQGLAARAMVLAMFVAADDPSRAAAKTLARGILADMKQGARA